MTSTLESKVGPSFRATTTCAKPGEESGRRRDGLGVSLNVAWAVPVAY